MARGTRPKQSRRCEFALSEQEIKFIDKINILWSSTSRVLPAYPYLGIDRPLGPLHEILTTHRLSRRPAARKLITDSRSTAAAAAGTLNWPCESCWTPCTIPPMLIWFQHNSVSSPARYSVCHQATTSYMHDHSGLQTHTQGENCLPRQSIYFSVAVFDESLPHSSLCTSFTTSTLRPATE